MDHTPHQFSNGPPLTYGSIPKHVRYLTSRLFGMFHLSIWSLSLIFSICVTLYGCVQCEHSYIDIGWWALAALPCENTVEMNAA
jgi:RNase P/RNase MRP subunit POP5